MIYTMNRRLASYWMKDMACSSRFVLTTCASRSDIFQSSRHLIAAVLNRLLDVFSCSFIA